jgi:hypothetical protein
VENQIDPFFGGQQFSGEGIDFVAKACLELTTRFPQAACV